MYHAVYANLLHLPEHALGRAVCPLDSEDPRRAGRFVASEQRGADERKLGTEWTCTREGS
jgi:hypothetical protein